MSTQTSAATPLLLETKGLQKDFGGLRATNDVSLTVKRGELLAIIGPNGAGKSTFFNLLSGFLKPDSGSVIFKGEDLTQYTPQRICRMGMSRSFQIAAIFNRMTVLENVQAALFPRHGMEFKFLASARKMLLAQATEILEAVGLLEQVHTVGGVLSQGDRKRLELAMVLGSQPELLLLDEPTAGMSSVETAGIMELVQRFNRDHGLTIIFTEHNISVVFGAAKRIAVLHQGTIIADGLPEEIRNSETVQRVYLGE